MMARRATGSADRGEYLPQLADGIHARHAYLAAFMPGVGKARADALVRREQFLIDATDVWSALCAVDPPAADRFKAEHEGPWAMDDQAPMFEYEPSTSVLVRVRSWETSTGFRRDVS